MASSTVVSNIFATFGVTRVQAVNESGNHYQCGPAGFADGLVTLRALRTKKTFLRGHCNRKLTFWRKGVCFSILAALGGSGAARRHAFSLSRFVSAQLP